MANGPQPWRPLQARVSLAQTSGEGFLAELGYKTRFDVEDPAAALPETSALSLCP